MAPGERLNLEFDIIKELRIGLQKEQDVEQVKRLIAYMEEKGWTAERAISQIKTALGNATFYNRTWTYETILNATEPVQKKEMPKPELVFFYNEIEKSVCIWDIIYSGKCRFPNIPFLDYMNNLDKRKEYDEYLGVPDPEKELKLLAEKASGELSFPDYLKQYSIYLYSETDPEIRENKAFEKRILNNQTFVFIKNYSEKELNRIILEYKGSNNG